MTSSLAKSKQVIGAQF